MIKIRGLNKSFGKKQVLYDLNLEIGGGRIIGLVGPNGSGKTTLLKILGGFDQLFTGDIEIIGEPIGIKTKNYTSYLPDRPSLSTWMTARQCLIQYDNFFPDFNLNKAEKMLEHFKLSPTQVLNTMSKGMQEKLQIVLTISREAKVYLLDEPISGVDPAARKIILQSILQNFTEDSLMIISTHLLDDIETIIDEVIFLENGRVKFYELADNLRGLEGKSLSRIFEEAY